MQLIENLKKKLLKVNFEQQISQIIALPKIKSSAALHDGE